MVPNAPLTPADDLRAESGNLSLEDQMQTREQSTADALARLNAEESAAGQLADDRARLLAEVARLEAERQAWELERERLLAELDSRSEAIDRESAAIERERGNREPASESSRPSDEAVSEREPVDGDGRFVDETTGNTAETSDPFARLQCYLREQPRANDDPATAAGAPFSIADEDSQVDDEDEDEPQMASAVSTEIEDETEEAIEEEDVPVESCFEEAPRRPATLTPAHEEESIEDYMAQLLNRMRGGSADSGGSSASRPSEELGPAPPVKQPESIPVQVSDRTDSDQAEPAAAAAPVAPRPMERASRPQLKPADLAAMREVANMQARNALDKHHRSRMSETVTGKLALAAIVLAMSVYALCFAEDFGSRMAAGIGASLSGYWAIQGALAAAEYIRRHKKPAAETKTPDAPAEKPRLETE